MISILTIRNYDQLYQRCLRHCINFPKTLYADLMSRRHLLKVFNSVASKHHVWLTYLLNVSKIDALQSHFHNAWRTIPQIVLRWFSSIPASFMPLVDGGHTAWIHTSNQFHRICRWFPNAYAKLDNRDCAAQRHPLTPSLFDTLVKTLATLDVKKQQISNFTEMTSGRYVSI